MSRTHYKRISRAEMMTEIVKVIAQRGTCRRAQVGCVIEKDGRILAIGYNGSLSGEAHCLDEGCIVENDHCTRTIHAEANAICWSAKNGIKLDGATLWVYGWHSGCCPACKKLVMSAGIKEIKEVPLCRE